MGTWNAYGNEYWPADYLIDANGQVRYTAFGEGDYGKTETAIRALLAQAGAHVGAHAVPRDVVTPSSSRRRRPISAPRAPNASRSAPTPAATNTVSATPKRCR